MLLSSLLLCCFFGLLAQPADQTQSGETQINTGNGRWFFSFYPNQIIKTRWVPTNQTKNEQVSDAVILKASNPAMAPQRNGNGIVISKEGNSIRIEGTQIKYQLANGQQVTLLQAMAETNQYGYDFSLQPTERLFGTGERSIPLNRRGYRVPLNNNPWYGYGLNADALNYSVPFVLSDQSYGIFFDNPSLGSLDMGKTVPDQLQYRCTSGEMSFYIIPGKSMPEVLNRYHRLVGTQPLPPRWALGNFMSRFGYRSEKQTQEIVQQMQADSIPVDAIIFDLFWFGDSIKNTLGNLDWVNKHAWPDPKKMLLEWKKQNIHSILITEPFVLQASKNYTAALPYLATDSAGNPFTLTDFYFGLGGIIDIFRKDAGNWFFQAYKKQLENGVSGWWGDLGEPEKHPAAVYHNLKDLGFKRLFAAPEVHNIYGHYWSKMLFEACRKNYPNMRLFHLNRSGYAGTPRYSSFPWSGDVSRSWDGLKAQLPLMLGMSLSAVPYIHSDAGGFAGGDGDGELYTRWLQFAAFTPIFRPHGTALGSVEPGVKDIPSEAALWPEPYKSIARRTIRDRYEWLPYNYTLSYQQSVYGKPLVSPLFFQFPADSNAYSASDEYFWGDQALVIPILEKDQRVKTYYLPAGGWYREKTTEYLQGPIWYTDSSIQHDAIPVYIKAGSFVPKKIGLINTSGYDDAPLHVYYYPSAENSSYTLYEDDGSSADALRSGQYALTRFSSVVSKNVLTIQIVRSGKWKPAKPKNALLHIPATQQPIAISLNGKNIPVTLTRKESGNGISIPFNPATRNRIRIQFK